MRKIADFVVNKRLLVLAVMVVLTIVSAIFIPQVKVNTDMTKYLPDDSPMKMGLELMEQEFPGMEMIQTIRVMFNNLSDAQKQKVKKALGEIPYVDSVTYEADSEAYNKEAYTLFVVGTSYDYNSPEEVSIEKAIQENFAQYDVQYITDNPNPNMSALPSWAIPLALTVVVIVLLLMCGSWVEPFLFLAAIGMAVVINSGTNIFLGSVSNITSAIAAILQLVLSMDYSLILMNRYRQEQKTTPDQFEAMRKALINAFSSITSSSLTTILGLLVMVFMSLKIGLDMGLVLAKGVLLSMLCIFTVLPGFILTCDKLIQKTSKKSLHFHMEKIGAFSYKSRRVVAVVFLVLFIGSYILQGNMKITTFLAMEDPIADVFTPTNPLVMIYDNADEKKMSELSALLEDEPHVESVLNYGSTLGKSYRADQMADTIKSMADADSSLGQKVDMDFDLSLLNILYYDYYMDGKIQPIVVSDFLRFVSEDVMRNATFSEYLNEDIQENVNLMKKFADPNVLSQPMNAEGLADVFEMKPEDIEQLLLFYYTQNGGVNTGRMTLPVFLNFIVSEVAISETYSSMFGADVLAQMKMLTQFTDKAVIQKQMNSLELSAVLEMDSSMMEQLMSFYYGNKGDLTAYSMTLPDFTGFLVDSVMEGPYFSSSFDEATKVALTGMNQMIHTAASGKTVTSEQLGQMLGMDRALMDQLLMLYFDGSVEEKNVTLPEFTGFLVNFVLKDPAFGGSFDEATKVQLISIDQLVSTAASGQEFTYEQLAGALQMDSSLVRQMFVLHYGMAAEGKTMSLEQMVDFLLSDIVINENFATYFDKATM